MKTILLLACLMSFIFCGPCARSQGGSGEPDNYVVVIGAFLSKDNADRFVRNSKKNQLSPAVELNRIRNLYYVFVLETGDKSAALAEAQRLQDNSPYSDTWVFNGTLRDKVIVQQPVVVPVEVHAVEIKPVVEEPKPAPIDPVKERDEKIKLAVSNKQMALKKGEKETLDYIFFFRDAAILRPESQHEVDRLVLLMNKHPEEKIRIHGHTNGNDRGKIIRMKNPYENFFSLDNSVEGSGSAIELSEMRANVIRDYLIKNGIDKTVVL